MDSKQTAAIVLSFLAFLLALIGTFAPGWFRGSGDFRGFFGVCLSGKCESTSDFLNATSGTKASAAFMIIGTFVLLAGFILILLGAKNSDFSKLKNGGIVTVIGGFAVLIGVAVFAGIFPRASFSFSFGFAWVSAFFGIAGGALAIMTAKE